MLCPILFWGQKTNNWGAHFYQGNILLHNDNISHLIQGHPKGLILDWQQRTDGNKEWHHLYNFPEIGTSFVYQNMGNAVLGEQYGLYAHFNFYMLQRKLMLRIGQGMAYNTHPYDRESNYKNAAYGSHLLSSTYLLLNYNQQFSANWKINAGLSLFHYSNGNVKAPNTSTNTLALNLGVNYQIKEHSAPNRKKLSNKYSEPIAYYLGLSGGINQSDVVGSKQYPFYILSAFAAKRINKKSSLTMGTDVFFSRFLKELIRYQSISYPEKNVSGNEDYKRLGLFVGHELHLGKLSMQNQIGYYVYYPFDFEGRMYLRNGLKYRMSDRISLSLSLKSHAAQAEAIEWGISYRLN